MPQMAPMMWFFLMIFFFLLFLFFNILNYFILIKKKMNFSKLKNENNKQTNFLTWKW